MTVWVTTDWHLFHHRSIELGFRKEGDVEKILHNYVKNVKDDDIVINLGDFSFGNKENTKEVCKIFKGRNFLVIGNHDSVGRNWHHDVGFDFVCSSFTWRYKGFNILFTHMPAPDCLVQNYDLNIFGHWHGNLQYTNEKQRHISLEHSNFKLYNLDVIIGNRSSLHPKE